MCGDGAGPGVAKGAVGRVLLVDGTEETEDEELVEEEDEEEEEEEENGKERESCVPSVDEDQGADELLLVLVGELELEELEEEIG